MYVEYQPPAGLGRYIESIWIFDPAGSRVRLGFRTVRNHGIAELAIQLGDLFKQCDDHDSNWIPRECLTGFMTRPRPIAPSGEAKTVGIRFRPCGLSLYSRIPCHELANRIVDARDVVSPRLMSAIQGIPESAPNDAIVRYLRTALIRSAWRPVDERNSPVELFIKNFQSGKQETIDGFCWRTGISIRTLQRWFVHLVGVTPARYLRALRFRQVLHCLTAGGPVHWSEIAADCGFSDQAHLSREFKAFAGLTPRQVVQRHHPGNAGRNASPLLILVAGTNAIF